MRDTLALRILLVSGDGELIQAISKLGQTEPLKPEIEIASNVENAVRQLCRHKYEGIVIDFAAAASACSLLQKQRATTSNKTAIAWAVVSNDQQRREAFQQGANFIVARPLSPDLLERIWKASFPLMLHEKRRYERLELDAVVSIATPTIPRSPARALNISEGGIAISSSLPLSTNETVTLTLVLPGQDREISMDAEICWKRDDHIGLQFGELAFEAREHLRSWIEQRFEDCLALRTESGLSQTAG